MGDDHFSSFSVQSSPAAMPHSFGYRARTRDMFKRGFKNHGMINLSTYMKTYKVGDIVDIKANAAEQKGMPHKYYHGRTGIVYTVTPRAVGVIVYKIVGNRYMEKRVNLRIEHVVLKRLPAAPRESRTVSTSGNQPQTLQPQPYDTTI